MVWVAQEWMVTSEVKRSTRCSSQYSESCWLFETFICLRTIGKLWLLGKWVTFEWFDVLTNESVVLTSGELKYLLYWYGDCLRFCRLDRKKKQNRMVTVNISIYGVMALLSRAGFITFKGTGYCCLIHMILIFFLLTFRSEKAEKDNHLHKYSYHLRLSF